MDMEKKRSGRENIINAVIKRCLNTGLTLVKFFFTRKKIFYVGQERDNNYPIGHIKNPYSNLTTAMKDAQEYAKRSKINEAEVFVLPHPYKYEVKSWKPFLNAK